MTFFIITFQIQPFHTRHFQITSTKWPCLMLFHRYVTLTFSIFQHPIFSRVFLRALNFNHTYTVLYTKLIRFTGHVTSHNTNSPFLLSTTFGCPFLTFLTSENWTVSRIKVIKTPRTDTKCQLIRSSLLQIMGCCAGPLSEPMHIIIWTLGNNFNEIWIKIQQFSWRRWVSKWHLQHGCHFVLV